MRPTVLRPNEGTKFPLARVLRNHAITRLRAVAYDEVISYEELSAAIGVDVVLDKRGRTAVLQAARVVLKQDQKKLVNIRTIGYRIVRPNEQVAVSAAEQQRSRRWLKRSLDTVTHVALHTLTPVEVAAVITEQARVALTLSFERKLQKQELPSKDQLLLPSGERLVEMFRKRA
jgi:hypothetical protein